MAADSPPPPLGPENSGDLSSGQPDDDFDPLGFVTTYVWQEPPRVRSSARRRQRDGNGEPSRDTDVTGGSATSSRGSSRSVQQNLEQKLTKETKGKSRAGLRRRLSPWPPRIEAARVIASSVFFVSFVPFCSNVLAFVEGCREIQAAIEEDCPRKGRKDTETESRSAGKSQIFPFSSRPWLRRPGHADSVTAS
jgi:hypothetical protein